MTFDVDVGFTSLAGVREHNEDFAGAILPAPPDVRRGCIAAIADGVSTGGRGKEAAMTSVTSLVRDYFCVPQTWDTTVALDRLIAAQNSWLVAQNRRQSKSSNASEQGDGMTTLTALVLRGHTWTMAHVGDSRAYLLRSGQMMLLSQDHVRDSVNQKHVLVRALGADDRVLVDYSQGELQVGDTFLLITDGVHTRVRDQKIAKLLEEASAQEASEAIVNAAISAASQDNCTALVMRVKGIATNDLQDSRRRAKVMPVPSLLKVGSMLDQYTVTSLVSNTGINIVYQVRDRDTQKLYALKTLHPQREQDIDERAMLAHEAWLAGRLTQDSRGLPPEQRTQSNSYFVDLHDTPNASAFYLLYDWHSGQTLEQKLSTLREAKAQMSLPEILKAATAVLAGIGRLHRQGVIHRDIKPANLYESKDGFWRILDLGVAVSGNESQDSRMLHAGTPSYINPEQWGYMQADGESQAGNAKSDLFAFGVTLYEMLTGKLPYGDVLPYQVGRYSKSRSVVPPSQVRPEVPIWLDHIALKAISITQIQRFETAEEFILALERGAARPLLAPNKTSMLDRDPQAIWKIGLAISVLINALLIYWLLFLPR